MRNRAGKQPVPFSLRDQWLCQKWSSGLLKPNNELSLTAENSDLHTYSNSMFSLILVFCFFKVSKCLFPKSEALLLLT